jgi:hypothetical protein
MTFEKDGHHYVWCFSNDQHVEVIREIIAAYQDLSQPLDLYDAAYLAHEVREMTGTLQEIDYVCGD